MEFREKEFVKLPNPRAYALFLLRAHKEKRNWWQRFVHKQRWQRLYKDYDGDVQMKMVYKLHENGLFFEKYVGEGKSVMVPTKKGLRAIRNRRVDYDVSWWTIERDRWITRVMALFAIIVSIVALFA